MKEDWGNLASAAGFALTIYYLINAGFDTSAAVRATHRLREDLSRFDTAAGLVRSIEKLKSIRSGLARGEFLGVDLELLAAKDRLAEIHSRDRVLGAAELTGILSWVERLSDIAIRVRAQTLVGEITAYASAEAVNGEENEEYSSTSVDELTLGFYREISKCHDFLVYLEGSLLKQIGG